MSVCGVSLMLFMWKRERASRFVHESERERERERGEEHPRLVVAVDDYPSVDGSCALQDWMHNCIGSAAAVVVAVVVVAVVVVVSRRRRPIECTFT